MPADTPPIILVIDDDRDLLQLIRMDLERHGYAVETRTQAPAREEIGSLRPAVIFMDVGLLNENGAALCRAIKEDLGAAQPVILISGHDDHLLHQEADLAHADTCMVKPFTLEAVRSLAAFYAPLQAA